MHKHKQSQCKRKVKHRKNVMGLIIFCITVCIVFMFAYYQNLRKEISVRQEWLETVLTREKKWILENQGLVGLSVILCYFIFTLPVMGCSPLFP